MPGISRSNPIDTRYGPLVHVRDDESGRILTQLCPTSWSEGVWWPKFPRSAFWRRRADGGQGLSKRIRCQTCRRRMPATLHTRVEHEDGRLFAFLFEMPEHKGNW